MATLMDVHFISHSGSFSIPLVACITVHGVTGDIGIMGFHVPIFTEIKPGIVSVLVGSSDKRLIYTSGGFLRFLGNTCSIQSRDCVDISSFDKEVLNKTRAEALNVVNDASSPEALKSLAKRKLVMCECVFAALEGVI